LVSPKTQKPREIREIFTSACFQSRHGPERGRVPLAPPGLLGLARIRFPPPERVGLAMLLAAGFVEALAEFAVL
jgi:hypothetical protein